MMPEKGFQISRLQLFEMINELFADTVVISHHEKLCKRCIIQWKTAEGRLSRLELKRLCKDFDTCGSP